MKSFIKVVFVLLFTYFFLLGIVSKFKETTSTLSTENFDEFSEEDSTGVMHARYWFDQDYYNSFNAKYRLWNISADYASESRNSYDPPLEDYSSHDRYWGSIYRYLVNKDSLALRPINDSLFQVGNDFLLNRTEFANMLVAFVQDIPYHYVIPGECTSENDDHPCLPNEKFGILSPVEFLYTLSGDCDTRTTLLYQMLNHFGYETIVLISREYAHAMLGVNIPSSGDYIRHKGRKFYFWETTAIGWKSGMIPDGLENKNYWKIALDYE